MIEWVLVSLPPRWQLQKITYIAKLTLGRCTKDYFRKTNVKFKWIAEIESKRQNQNTNKIKYNTINIWKTITNQTSKYTPDNKWYILDNIF